MDPKDRHEYLKKSLGPEFVSRRPGPGGTDISYISGHSAINLANEVFGYDGWSSEVRETKVDFEDIDSDGRISVGMASKVRVTLACGAFREDWGSGAAENMRNKAAAFDKARKSSTTDGLKRALHLFGNMLGNCLYDKNYLQSIRSVPRPMIPFIPKDLYRHPDVQKRLDEQEAARASSSTKAGSSTLKSAVKNEPGAKIAENKPNSPANSTKTSANTTMPVKQEPATVKTEPTDLQYNAPAFLTQRSFLIDEEDDEIFMEIAAAVDASRIPVSPAPPEHTPYKRQRS